MAEHKRNEEISRQEEELKQKDTVNKESSDIKLLDAENDSENHRKVTQPVVQKEQATPEMVEQVTSSKLSTEIVTPEKAVSKPVPHRASTNVPMGKKPTSQKQFMPYASPPKHASPPKSMANLQSEFQQAGYEIEDGYDSDENQNTFSEFLPREETECISTTSLEDSLIGSESFLSLDNYNKEVGSQKQKPSRVGSAKERDRKISQENELQLKERRSLQEGETQLKEPRVGVTSTSQPQGEEALQKPAGSLANEIAQASESHSTDTIEPSADLDATKDKGAGGLVDATAAKKVALTKQTKPFSLAATADNDVDDSTSESDSSDEDGVIIKGDYIGA